MIGGQFFKRFSDSQEIGRDITDSRLSVFYDNGREVGCWREDRRTTIGMGEVLGEKDAELARDWFQEECGQKSGRQR